jgi:small-conductance mechanosensitive channel
LEAVLQQNEKIDKSPAPLVLLHQFNNSSVDFRLLFWTDISQWVELKSEIIIAIDDCFAKEGIVIPFPQMVVHIEDKQGEKAKPEPK